MKYQKILGLVATAGLLLAGCATDSDNSNTWLSDPNAVHVSASVGSIFTRSNPAASDEDKQMNFNTGDVMGVSNNGTSITYTYNKGTNDWQRALKKVPNFKLHSLFLNFNSCPRSISSFKSGILFWTGI